MKINSTLIAGINTYKQQSQRTKESQPKKVTEDKVEISSSTREMHTKFEAERQERVQELKRQIQNGEYKVDTRKVAESLIAFYSVN